MVTLLLQSFRSVGTPLPMLLGLGLRLHLRLPVAVAGAGDEFGERLAVDGVAAIARDGDDDLRRPFLQLVGIAGEAQQLRAQDAHGQRRARDSAARFCRRCETPAGAA